MPRKKKRILATRRHVSAPEWMWSRLSFLALADGRSTSELVRRLILNYLREADPEGLPLPNARRIASYARASRSLDGTAGGAGKRKPRK